VTVFIVVAAVMVAAAVAWVLVPLLRSPKPEGIDREAANVAILRDQLAELEADLAAGSIPRPQYDQARRELEQRVLEESKAIATARAAPPPRAGAWAAAILGGVLPIAALALYAVLGNHDALSPSASMATAAGSGGGGGSEGQHDLSPDKVAEMAASLAAKLEQNPGNGEGWVILARTYNSMGRFPEAVRAYEKAVALIPDDAALFADYADALAATQKDLAGKPMELVQRALKLDPTQWKALALAGTYAFDRKEYRQAVEYWEKLKATVPPGSPFAQSIDGSIAEARSLGSITTAMVPAMPSGATAAPPAQSAAMAPAAPAKVAKAPAALPGMAIGGTVKLSPAVAARAAPSDLVFIFARPVEGARMPLAIIRTTVKDLPTQFSLDDSMAMTPEAKISNFAEVVVGARVSKSGNAIPASGDLEGFSKPVKIGATGIEVVIDTQRP
jgi:cytochrome c-type biogenesis protein CcmH